VLPFRIAFVKKQRVLAKIGELFERFFGLGTS
jgi:hypothetical protein